LYWSRPGFVPFGSFLTAFGKWPKCGFEHEWISVVYGCL
jgi:hypothetical protein